MQRHIDFLGALGLVPFLGLPALVLLNQLSWYEGVGLFTLYSGVILSFFGGVHWYDAIHRSHSISQLYVAMFPSIIAWFAIALTHGDMTLLLLAISYVLVLIYDFQQLKMTASYSRLRVMLTGIVIGCHIFMFWLA